MATERVGYELTLRDLMSKGLNDINSKLGQLEGKLKQTEKSGQGMSENLGKAFKYIGGALAVGKLYEYGKEIVLTTARFQSLSNSIKFASDTSVQGEASMIWLKDMSNRYGLPVEETAEGFKTLQGALIKTKFSSNDVRKMFEQVSTGAVAMGLSADDTKGVFLALGQIMGKGKVSAEELRGQIGERVPGAFAVAARAMGKTTAELDKMMKDGKLIAEDFLPKFAAEMEKTFGEGANKNVDSITASLNRLSNSWVEFQTTAGNTEAFGFIYKSIDGYSKLLKGITQSLKSEQQIVNEKNNPHVINYLSNFEERIRGIGEDLKKKGYSKEQIEGEYKKEVGSEVANLDRLLSLANKDLENKRNNLIPKTFKEKLIGVPSGKLEDYEKQQEKIDLIKKEKAGAEQSLDKLLQDLYRPSNTTTEESEKKLKEESNSISGSQPKTVNIHVDALIKGTVNNIIEKTNTAKGDLKDFMNQLEQSLLTVVNDVNIITE